MVTTSTGDTANTHMNYTQPSWPNTVKGQNGKNVPYESSSFKNYSLLVQMYFLKVLFTCEKTLLYCMFSFVKERSTDNKNQVFLRVNSHEEMMNECPKREKV